MGRGGPVLQSLVRAGVALGCAALIVGAAPARSVAWRHVGDTAGFPEWRHALRELVDDRRAAGVPATFCVVLRDDGDGEPLLYALWRERSLLYRWNATNDARLGPDTLLLGGEPLDLRRDIIHTATDRLSTYKVTRAWAADVETQCRLHGETVRIRRSAR